MVEVVLGCRPHEVVTLRPSLISEAVVWTYWREGMKAAEKIKGTKILSPVRFSNSSIPKMAAIGPMPFLSVTSPRQYDICYSGSGAKQ